jgi:hypothetical protein
LKKVVELNDLNSGAIRDGKEDDLGILLSEVRKELEFCLNDAELLLQLFIILLTFL